jgi:tol-pal system protein YbgF
MPSKEEPLKTFGRMRSLAIVPIWMLVLGWATTRDVQVLDQQIGKLYSELDALRKENKSLNSKLSDLSEENQKLKTELLFKIETLQSEVRTLSTGIEEYKDYAKKPSKEIGRVKEDVEVRLKVLEERRKSLEEKNRALEEKIKEMEDRLKATEGKLKQAESEKLSPAKEASAETRGLSAGMGDLYRDAYEAFQKGNYEGSRKKFEAFLKQYPNTELSGNAQFWISETYFQKKDFERAILEYEKTITKYPEGGKVPAALFKQALAFLELGDKTNARNLLRRVIDRFPNSEQAEVAKKKLGSLK